MADYKIAEEYLANVDPELGKLITHQKLEIKTRPENYFESLCRSIIGQQVSVKAAETIFERFKFVTGVMPGKVNAMKELEIKQIGLSRQKASYLKDLAEKFHNDSEVFNHLENLSDEEVIKELINIKGIGIWTAQMFLIFTLQRPDIFAPDDVGLQKAMIKLYNWNILPPKAELIKTTEKWSPYRTIACLHLWHSLDNVS